MIRYVLVAFSYLIAARSNGLLGGTPIRSVTGNGYTGTTAVHGAGVAENTDASRLPNDVLPVSYRLEVATDFGDFSYTGQVDIVVRATDRTCRVILNAKDVRVTDVNVIDEKLNEPLTVVDYHLVDRDERLVIALNGKTCLTSSRTYIVKVVFGASFRGDMTGFYKSSYKENNVNKYGNSFVQQLSVTNVLLLRYADPCFAIAPGKKKMNRCRVTFVLPV